MPDYTIRDPRTGDTVRVRGSSPPSEQELEAIFAERQQRMDDMRSQQGQLRPHEPGLMERGLSGLSQIPKFPGAEPGGIPSMLSGALRDIAAPISRGVDYLRPMIPDSGSAPGLDDAIDNMFGRTSKVSGEYANPDEELGAGLARGEALLSLPGAAPGIVSGIGTARRRTADLLDNPITQKFLPTGKEPGVMGMVGQARQIAADALRGPNAARSASRPMGGTLVRETVDDAVRNATGELLDEGGRYTELGLSHPEGGGFTVPPTLPTPGGRLAKSPRPPGLDDELTNTLEELMRPESADLPFSHPTGGGFTVPAPMQPAGGRLGGRAAPGPGMSEDITSILDELMKRPSSRDVPPSHPMGGGFTVPPDAPTAGVRAKPPKPPSTPPVGATETEHGIVNEITKRDMSKLDYLGTPVVSRKALTRNNLGGEALASEDYEALRIQMEEAIKAGDLKLAQELRSRVSQRRKITAKQQAREAEGK